MKVFKRLIFVLLSLVLLLVIAAVALVILVDPNQYKPEIVATVEEHTGRTLSLEGDLSFTFYPWLGVQTGQLELGGHAKQDAADYFARIDSASAGVKLMSLFGDQIEVAGIELVGADINLIKFRNGGSNWDDLAKQSGDPATPETDGSASTRSFTLSGIELSDSKVRYRDLAAGSDLLLDDVNISVSAIEPGQPISLDGGLVFSSGDKEPIPVRTALTVLQQGDLLELSKMSINAEVPGLGPVEVAGTALMDQGKDRLDSQLTTLALGPMSMNGALAISKLSGAGNLSGSLQIDEFSPRELMEKLDMDIPETSDDTVLRKASGTITVGGQLDRIRVDPLVFRLDDTQLSGNLSIGDQIGFALNVDTLNIDRYLPPASETSSGSTTADDKPLLEPDMFKGLKVNGEATIDTLIASGLNMNEVTVKVNIANGMLTLNPSSKLYDGRLNGRISMAPARDGQLKAKLKLSAINAQPLLKDLAGSDLISGLGRFEIDITSNASTQSSLLSSLTGTGNFLFRDGSINGINVAQSIRKAQALFGESADEPPSTDSLKTDFSALGASFEIVNGVVKNNDLDMKSPLLRVTGTGQANLAEQTLDYTITPVVVETLEGQGGSGLGDLEGVGIPIRFRGALTSPEYEVDIAGAIKASQHAAIEEKKDELKEKASSKLFELLGGKDEDEKEDSAEGDDGNN
ncbi:MAG: cell envelope biogenesis protein AsmA [Lysobacteraceae bacterium]|nr:MAG: cell envelope biogenesis protein AsmA [Xanthomonadaceae bacterium]